MRAATSFVGSAGAAVSPPPEGGVAGAAPALTATSSVRTPPVAGMSKGLDSSRCPSTTASACTWAPAGTPVNSARPSAPVGSRRTAPAPCSSTDAPTMLLVISSRTTRTVTVPSGSSGAGIDMPDIARGSGICARRGAGRGRQRGRPRRGARVRGLAPATGVLPETGWHRSVTVASPSASERGPPRRTLQGPRAHAVLPSGRPHILQKRASASFVAPQSARRRRGRRPPAWTWRRGRIGRKASGEVALDHLAVRRRPIELCDQPQRARAQTIAHHLEVALGDLPHRAIELQVLDRAQREHLVALERGPRPSGHHRRVFAGSLADERVERAKQAYPA